MSARRRQPLARAVLPCVNGKFVLTPEAYTVRWTEREGLEQYLKYHADGVPKGEQAVLDTLQMLVDRLLGEVITGKKDPRRIFRPEPLKKRGERKDVSREQAIAQEVLRLSLLHDVEEPAAVKQVAGVFEVDVRTVQRAVKAWRAQPQFAKPAIAQYEQSLKIRRLLTS
jgi:hypothetical protein